MDNVFAIGVGLALRAVIDTITRHNHRVNGSLVGLWEGAVLHHFLAKFPRSLDPYVAFGFRLFVDLLFTASVTRMAIVLLWTGLGILLSDVGSDIAEDKRFRRLWRRVRRTLPSSVSRLFAPTRAPSRVQFLQVPPSSSTVSSNNTARSPPILLRSPVQTRSQPPPTPAPVRRPSTRPVPGSFSDWSEAETEASRASRMQQQQEQRVRTPSELEYMTLPTIPDTPGIETYSSFIRRPPRSVASGLTTSNESDSPAIVIDGPSANHSGLTTPVDRPTTPRSRGDELPPVTIIDADDEAQDRNRTPTMTSGELPDPPPIPIPMRSSSGMPHEFIDSQPAPFSAPPIAEMPSIPTPDDVDADADGARTERGIGTRSPPPSYPGMESEGGAADNASIAESEGTAPSVITTHSRSALVSRADTLRKEAEQLEAARSRLRQEQEAARRDKDYWAVFRLKVELDRVEQNAKQLHAKAERRYFIAHNLAPKPQEIDVHRLKVPEAVARVEQALYDAVISGVSELRIITGRGKHSKGKIPVLKLAIIGAMQDHHIEAVPDETNPGVLLVRPPTKPQPGPST